MTASTSLAVTLSSVVWLSLIVDGAAEGPDTMVGRWFSVIIRQRAW